MKNQSALFQLDSSVTYLNGAYMSPLLNSLAEIGERQVRAKLTPYKISGDDFFENVKAVKQEFSRLINSAEPDRIAIIPSVSYGLANVAKNIDVEGKEILVVAEQFPSNIYPWMELEKTQSAKILTVASPESLKNRGLIWNERVLEAINSNTGMVAISHTHWADGTLFNLKEIRKKTKEVGAMLIIDGTQSIGAYPFDVQEIEPDALICAGYKWLMGPYGIGVAYYGSAFDNGTPIEQNWINRKDSENFAGLVNYQEDYQPGAMRYSVGEQSNFILLPMMLEAIKQLNSWGVNNIQQYCKGITEKPLEILKEKGYWVEDIAFRGSHLFGIRKEGLDVEKIKEKLEKHHIFVSIRGSSIRVSPNVYNTEEDLMKLVNILN
ncbi:MAG: aminotransferase class V-fold PLP-dependent enzyme [Cyclobacteriaceae bacterium]|nr:aminotransferase class V-fold PLP-dependent enzyme [Cyclobacteriaceae bacterium]